MNALLLTAHVLNDYGESMPIAFALINEEDIDSVRAFYETLRELRPAAFSKIRILISDIAPAYYSASACDSPPYSAVRFDADIITVPSARLYLHGGCSACPLQGV